MRRVLDLIRHQFLGALAVFLVVGGFAMAKTGDPLRLGLANNADKTTTLTTTGNGAALHLKAKAGQPALKVNTTKAIEHLNASLLRGNKPTDFARAGSSYTKTESDARYSPAARAGPLVLANTNFFANAPADKSEASATTFTPTLPCTGTLAIFLALDPTGDTTTVVRVYVEGVLRETKNTGPTGGTMFVAVPTPNTGPLNYKIGVASTDGVAGSAGGNFVISLYTWC